MQYLTAILWFLEFNSDMTGILIPVLIGCYAGWVYLRYKIIRKIADRVWENGWQVLKTLCWYDLQIAVLTAIGVLFTAGSRSVYSFLIVVGSCLLISIFVSVVMLLKGTGVAFWQFVFRKERIIIVLFMGVGYLLFLSSPVIIYKLTYFALNKASNGTYLNPQNRQSIDMQEETRRYLYQDHKSVEQLLTDLRHPEPKIRCQAIESLRLRRNSAGAAIIAPIMRMVYDSNDEVRGKAVSALSDISDPRTVDLLIYALKDKKSYVRRGALRGLGNKKEPRSVAEIVNLLEDKDPMVGYEAMEALEAITGNKFGDNLWQWQNWWRENKQKYPVKEISIVSPDYSTNLDNNTIIIQPKINRPEKQEQNNKQIEE